MACQNQRMEELLEKFDEKSKDPKYIETFVYHLSKCNHDLEVAVKNGLIAKILTNEFAGPYLICLMRDWEQVKILRLNPEIAPLILNILPLALEMHERMVWMKSASSDV